MRILVTGGAGFIGSAVCRHLVSERGEEVLNFDKLTYAANLASLAPIDAAPGYRFVRGDVADPDALRAAFAAFEPEAVMHLAAETHVDRSIDSARPFVDANVVGVLTLLEIVREYLARAPAALAQGFRLLHVSTDEVFGSLGAEGFFHEASPYQPSSPYSASKAAGDHLVRAWAATYGLPTIVANCSNNYGPYQFPEKLIPLTILNGLEGAPLPVYGRGQNVRDWLFVEDHARALALILERGTVGETYVIGGEAERANLEVVEAICDLLDQAAPRKGAPPRRELITYVEDRPGHDHRYAIDCRKIKRELGWGQEVDLEAGLARTVRWYLDRADWWGPLRERYSGQRLGRLATVASSP
ncbi:MAG: dTDP-glucose 4,6-dehydratase [Caulobacteraceae bacterium]|nr:dTDP-glucose 4,6-dehydratase [Caulobacteraceae bacterium]